MTQEQAIAEGIEVFSDGRYKDYLMDKNYPTHGHNFPLHSFKSLWMMINYDWSDLDEVWVYEFEIAERPDNFLNTTNGKG